MTRLTHSIRFPGESPAYREARDELLQEEGQLRRQIEAVAEKRRQLPIGGRVPEDYMFDEVVQTAHGVETQVPLSELFEPGRDTLIIYSWMYGPQMPQPCVMCTSILDALDGEAPHIVQRVNLAVVAKSAAVRLRAFARERGWKNLRLLSSMENNYNRDYHAESAKGEQLPALNVFVRKDDGIHHFYNTELLYAQEEEGQNGRHVDMIWPLWNMFDLTPEGRGRDWYPRLKY